MRIALICGKTCCSIPAALARSRESGVPFPGQRPSAHRQEKYGFFVPGLTSLGLPFSRYVLNASRRTYPQAPAAFSLLPQHADKGIIHIQTL